LPSQKVTFPEGRFSPSEKVNFPPSGRANFSPSYYVKSKKILIWKGNFPPSGKVDFPFLEGRIPPSPLRTHVKRKKIPLRNSLQKGEFPQAFRAFLPLQTFPLSGTFPLFPLRKNCPSTLLQRGGGGKSQPCCENSTFSCLLETFVMNLSIYSF